MPPLFVLSVLEGALRILQSLVWKHSLKPTSLSQPLLNIRKFRPRHSQWLSWSCLLFPVSEGFVPTGGAISLQKHSEKLKAHVKVSTSAVIIAVIYWILPMPWSRSSPRSVCDPGGLYRSCTHKGPCSCFYALLCQLGILSSFWTGCRVFSFCSGPHQVCSCSWLLVFIYLVSFNTHKPSSRCG